MIILQDGSNSTVINIFKVALLPQEIFSKALKICQLYEDGELAPPLTSKQRMRKYISPSSFNFLKGLHPLKDEDQLKIDSMLTSWLATNIRPVYQKKVRDIFYEDFHCI